MHVALIEAGSISKFKFTWSTWKERSKVQAGLTQTMNNDDAELSSRNARALHPSSSSFLSTLNPKSPLAFRATLIAHRTRNESGNLTWTSLTRRTTRRRMRKMCVVALSYGRIPQLEWHVKQQAFTPHGHGPYIDFLYSSN